MFRVASSLVITFSSAFAPLALGGLIVHDSRFVSEVRLSSAPTTFPLAIDTDSSIYTVTGTALTDDLIRINTDNSVTTLNGNVGRVVGVIADMELAFGGDLFANYAQLPTGASGTHGVVRFDKATGAASTFFSSGQFNADGGLAFDSGNSVLYMQSQLADASLLALDSGGNATTIVAMLGQGRGLALEAGGTLVTIGQTEIRRVDPVTKSVSSILDIAADLPGYVLRSVDILSTGEIVFTASHSGTQTRRVYSIPANGGSLNLIATDTTWGPHQLKFGVSGDGLGESLYINNPNTQHLHELRFNAVPEPSVIAMLAVGAGLALVPRRRRWRRSVTG